MNIKIFAEGTVDDDWAITDNPADLQHLYDEIIYEIEAYAGDTSDDFCVMHDKTVYQILVVIKTILSKKLADMEVLQDLRNLANK